MLVLLNFSSETVTIEVPEMERLNDIPNKNYLNFDGQRPERGTPSLAGGGHAVDGSHMRRS